MANGLPGFQGISTTDDFRREQQDAQEAYLRGIRGAGTAQQQAMMAANPRYMDHLRRQAQHAMTAFRYSPEWIQQEAAGGDWGGGGRMGAFQDWVGAGGLSNMDAIRERMRTAASGTGAGDWGPERWEQLRQFEQFRPYEDRYTLAAQAERDRAFRQSQISRPTTGFGEARDYLGFQGWNPYVGQDVDPDAASINVTRVNDMSSLGPVGAVGSGATSSIDASIAEPNKFIESRDGVMSEYEGTFYDVGDVGPGEDGWKGSLYNALKPGHQYLYQILKGNNYSHHGALSALLEAAKIIPGDTMLTPEQTQVFLSGLQSGGPTHAASSVMGEGHLSIFEAMNPADPKWQQRNARIWEDFWTSGKVNPDPSWGNIASGRGETGWGGWGSNNPWLKFLREQGIEYQP